MRAVSTQRSEATHDACGYDNVKDTQSLLLDSRVKTSRSCVYVTLFFKEDIFMM